MVEMPNVGLTGWNPFHTSVVKLLSVLQMSEATLRVTIQSLTTGLCSRVGTGKRKPE